MIALLLVTWLGLLIVSYHGSVFALKKLDLL